MFDEMTEDVKTVFDKYKGIYPFDIFGFVAEIGVPIVKRKKLSPCGLANKENIFYIYMREDTIDSDIKNTRWILAHLLSAYFRELNDFKMYPYNWSIIKHYSIIHVGQIMACEWIFWKCVDVLMPIDVFHSKWNETKSTSIISDYFQVPETVILKVVQSFFKDKETINIKKMSEFVSD